MKVTLGQDEYTSEPVSKSQAIKGMTSLIKMNGTVVAASASDKLTEVIMLTLKRVWLARGIAKANPNLLTMVLDILTSLQPPKGGQGKKRPPRKKTKWKAQK